MSNNSEKSTCSLKYAIYGRAYLEHIFAKCSFRYLPSECACIIYFKYLRFGQNGRIRFESNDDRIKFLVKGSKLQLIKVSKRCD